MTKYRKHWDKITEKEYEDIQGRVDDVNFYEIGEDFFIHFWDEDDYLCLEVEENYSIDAYNDEDLKIQYRNEEDRAEEELGKIAYDFGFEEWQV